MTRDELEHIIRASGDITDQYEFMVIGSQSILGSVPNPEAIFTMSAEVDIYPLQAPELAEKIEGAIGEGPRRPPKLPRLWPPQTPPPELIGDRG